MQTPTANRIAQALDRRVQIVRHRGRAVSCPLCGHRFARFKDDRGRPNALCWRCGSHERHRAQWLLFERRPELLRDAHSLLHFAPEWALRRRLEHLGDLRYVTADLAAPGVDMRLDIRALDLADSSFDAVICSHVLEHVDEDARAMRELRRITAAGGWCLIMVPLDLTREHTYEDPTLTEPSERVRAYGQADHVRFYATDIAERLEQAGFVVEQISPAEEFGEEILARCRIVEADQMFLCRPGEGREASA